MIIADSEVCCLGSAITGGKERWQILSTSMGGLQRTWDRIKSYLNTWIASWKTTNFGSGTISVGGYDFIEVPVETYNIGGETLAVDYTVTKRHGMVVLFADNDSQYVTRASTIHSTHVRLVNNYGSMIYFVMIAYKTGLYTSSLSNGETKTVTVEEAPATFPVLIFW